MTDKPAVLVGGRDTGPMTESQAVFSVGSSKTRRPPRWHQTPSAQRVFTTTHMVHVLAFLAALAYAAFVLNPANRGDLVPYLILVVAEVILLLHTFGTEWTIAAGAGSDPVDHPDVVVAREALLDGTWSPTVDVMIPVYGEPLEVVAHTVAAARDMTVPHRTILCDDANASEMAALADAMGVEYVARQDNKGAKAGNLNNAISRSEGSFIAVFDADHAPHPEFLMVMLPHFVHDEVGFVQSPQSYRNIDESPISEAAASNQRVFYELVCPGKNAFDAQFHVGTNALLRREAIDSIGGYPSHSRSEDIWASLQMHRRGWSSVYVPIVIAQGLAPTTVLAHLRQQLRWASGAFEVVVQGKPWRKTGLTVDQRVQYMLPPLHFLQGLATQLFLLLPPMFILFDVQPIGASGSTWLLRFLPLFLLTQLAVALQLGTWRPWWMAVSTASAPVHLRALGRVLTGRASKARWYVTNVENDQPSVIEYMPVQIATLLLNLAALAVGIATLEQPLDSAIALGLCGLHVVMLGSVLLVAVRDRSRAPAGLASTPDMVVDLRPAGGNGF